MRRAAPWLVVPGAWLVVALLSSVVPNSVLDNGKLIRIPWRMVIAEQLRQYVWWVLLTPVAIFLARRFPFTARRPAIPIVVHVATAFASAIFITFGRMIVIPYFFAKGGPTFEMTFESVRAFIPQSMGTYALIVTITMGFDTYRRFLMKQKEAAELEAQLARAQLSLLRMQLEPHFLFNTLHTISALVDVAPADARRMITLLSELLRDTLDAQEKSTVGLSDELDWIERYLDIQQIRYGDHLRIEMNIDPRSLPMSVPALILQPLVENVIKHGVDRAKNAVTISVGSSVENEQLRLTVVDNAGGMPDGAKPSENIGLRNTRQRLHNLFGKRHTFSLESLGGTVRATIEIPAEIRVDQQAEAPTRG